MESQHLNLTTKVTTIKRNEGWRLAFLLVTLKKNKRKNKKGGAKNFKAQFKASRSFHPLRFSETCFISSRMGKVRAWRGKLKNLCSLKGNKNIYGNLRKGEEMSDLAGFDMVVWTGWKCPVQEIFSPFIQLFLSQREGKGGGGTELVPPCACFCSSMDEHPALPWHLNPNYRKSKVQREKKITQTQRPRPLLMSPHSFA